MTRFQVFLGCILFTLRHPYIAIRARWESRPGKRVRP